MGWKGGREVSSKGKIARTEKGEKTNKNQFHVASRGKKTVEHKQAQKTHKNKTRKTKGRREFLSFFNLRNDRVFLKKEKTECLL